MVHAVFMHPDLGIGGAERLVVDAGLALQERGHRVSYVTNHHDPSHCFSETRDGTFPIIVVGDWLPRSIFGYCHALCAYLRMFYLTLYVMIVIAPTDKPDILICDQIPIGIPLLKLFRYRVIFYCHFPDLLLSTPGGTLKKLYREPLNWIEEMTMSFANRILVNSRFTSTVFKETFKSITTQPTILYPSIHTKKIDTMTTNIPSIQLLNHPKDAFYFLSINRFERKKNLNLAISALVVLETILSDEEWQKVHLLIVGGHDSRVIENIEYYQELKDLCLMYKVMSKVTFIQSPSDELKMSLLSICSCVLYTPKNEHFGIVPLEAMYCKKPVIAVNSGGPTETVVHRVTGYLPKPIPEVWAHYMSRLISDTDLVKNLGDAGRSRFNDKFSFNAFSRHLNSIIFSEISND